ncbi:MAG: hypothetical protein CMF24_08655 [Ilumatobacter sp.]|nr:hypothetical protein [Ilumatobacter sp.]|tara:strand:+ start:360 stop:878 length:519 start_codon:yes stop_codon:yes gene_type:complete
MEVTPVQSVAVFGWWAQPRSVVAWEDIKKLNVSWRCLRDKYGFSSEQLSKVQPDKQEWVKRGALTLHDMPDMLVFPVNPFVDLGADIAEVWSMQWPVELLAQMDVTFEHMRARGLSAQLMRHFAIPLSGWQKLKLKIGDLEEWSDDYVEAVFSLERHELCDILNSYSVCTQL